jgi:16S rRNA (cytosine1402-N4)-methyltransferase
VSARHEPVLLDAVLAFLATGEGLYLDATLGDAGHAEALLEREPCARLLGTDRDPQSLAFARARLARFGDRVMLAHANFRELPGVHASAGGEALRGALLDLGLSSRQIEDPARGISFAAEGPLDMRMDTSRGATLSERLAGTTVNELADVLRRLGDVPQAARLARALVDAASHDAIPTTRALVAHLERALGGRPHPRRIAQVFQALRMWVNGEAEDLDFVMDWLPDVVAPGGVVVTLAYHSGEDRRIKQALRGPLPERRTRRLPEAHGMRPPEGPWESLTRKVVTPAHDEIARNPRARSARLRAFRRKSA